MDKNNNLKKENLGKYFLFGVIAAVIMFFVMNKINTDKSEVGAFRHNWSAEADSNFVKLCYEKYKPQVKDDLVKQETMKAFCRCMLNKIKSKYDEQDADKISDDDIKQWDKECRSDLIAPNQINIK